MIQQGFSKAYVDHFVFSGNISTKPYSLDKPSIKIVLKSGKVKPLEAFSSLFKGDAFTTLESKVIYVIQRLNSLLIFIFLH